MNGSEGGGGGGGGGVPSSSFVLYSAKVAVFLCRQSLLIHMSIVRIGYHEQESILLHTMLFYKIYSYLEINPIITQHLLSSKFGSFRKWESCQLGA